MCQQATCSDVLRDCVRPQQTCQMQLMWSRCQPAHKMRNLRCVPHELSQPKSEIITCSFGQWLMAIILKRLAPTDTLPLDSVCDDLHHRRQHRMLSTSHRALQYILKLSRKQLSGSKLLRSQRLAWL